MSRPLGVTVRGGATAEELAAVLAVLAGASVGDGRPAVSGYERWREIRRRALREIRDGDRPNGRADPAARQSAGERRD